MDFEKIKKLARRRDLTVKEALTKMNIPVSNFYNWQRKGSIETRYLEIIAKFFDVPVGYFFDEPSKGNVITGDFSGNNISNKISVKVNEQAAEIERLKAELSGCRDLLKSKDEIIQLLKNQLKNNV